MPRRRRLIWTNVPRAVDDLPIATSEGDLRETFDLPLMSGRDAERGQAAAGPATADAAALFQDHGHDETAGHRRRSKIQGPPVLALRQRRAPGDVDLPDLRHRSRDRNARRPRRRPGAAAAAPSSRPPLHVSIIGGLCGTAAIIVMLAGVIKSTQGQSSVENYAWLALAAGLRLRHLRLRSVHQRQVRQGTLARADLGVAVDVLGLVAIPIIQPMFEDQDQIVNERQAEGLDESDIADQTV